MPIYEHVTLEEFIAAAAKEDIVLTRADFTWSDEDGYLIDSMDPYEWLDAITTDSEEN